MNPISAISDPGVTGNMVTVTSQPKRSKRTRRMASVIVVDHRAVFDSIKNYWANYLYPGLGRM